MVFLLMLVFDVPGTSVGLLDSHHVLLLVFTSVASLALACHVDQGCCRARNHAGLVAHERGAVLRHGHRGTVSR